MKIWSFWTKPQTALAISLYRLCVGVLCLTTAIMLYPDLYTWYGSRSWLVGVPDWAHAGYLGSLAANDTATTFIYCALVLGSLGLTIGLFTRASALVVWLTLYALSSHNPFITNGGDGLLRISAFFLIFANAGSAFAVDRHIRRGLSLPDPARNLYRPWVQRLLQLQIACVYWQAFWGKIEGPHWIDGSAIYYVTHLPELQRVYMPLLFDNLWMSKLLTWGTLVFEAVFWSLVWFKPLRYPILLAGIVLHVGMDLALNIPVFEWIMIASYILFVDEDDLRAWLAGKKKSGALPAGNVS